MRLGMTMLSDAVGEVVKFLALTQLSDLLELSPSRFKFSGAPITKYGVQALTILQYRNVNQRS